MKATLHWVDMVGNRVAPVAFGPRHVILLAGANKLVATPGGGAGTHPPHRPAERQTP